MNEIIVVSGLPRSGTSAMMQMLERGGIEILSDGLRAADADNPEGYREYERVKRLAHDPGCLDVAPGKAVKIISELLPHLPSNLEYRIIFMRRNMDEVLASQAIMLQRRNQPAGVDDPRLRSLLIRHVNEMIDLLRGSSNARVLYVSYNRMMEQPGEVAAKVASFLERPLDVEMMVAAVKPALHRNRR